MKRYLVIWGVVFSLILVGCGKTPEKEPAKESSNSTAQTTERTSDTGSAETVSKAVEGKMSDSTANEASNQGVNGEVHAAITVRKYSAAEREAIAQAFLSWAVDRAILGGMSVSGEYFGHGSGGIGDWYGVTVDGRIQTQEESAPGYEAFELHSLGGVVFYTSLDGSVGLNETFESIAAGYSPKADPNKKITKYILADTGNVYEYGTADGSMISFSAGFTEASNDGAFINDAQLPVFQQSADQDAIAKLKEILLSYQ